MAGMNLQWLAQFSAERMLSAVAAGTLIAIFAWLVLRLLSKQNSGTRFAVWFAALMAIAVLPFSGLFAPSPASSVSPAEFTVPGSWATYLFIAWAVIASFGLARVAVGLWQLRRLRKSSVPVAVENLDETLRKTLREFDSRRQVTLCTSALLKMPTAVGFVRPLVVVPEWALKELSLAELNSILLHELAHLRRWDDCTNLAQKILGAVLFFHPAVWWIERKLTLEREMACDDLVLERTENPHAYAETLVALAEKGFLRRGLALAQAAVGRMRDTTLRIKQILDGGRPRATRVWTPALLLIAGFAFAFTMIQAHMPRLVGFENEVPAANVESAGVDSSIVPEAPAVPAKLNMNTQPLVRKESNNAPHLRRKMASPEFGRGSQGTPGVVRTSIPQTPMIPTILVVMRTEEIQGPNAVRWTLSVWRVTVMAPMQVRDPNGVAAKAI